MERAIMAWVLVILLIILVVFLDKKGTFKRYVNIDGCIYLETNYQGGYSGSQTNTLIGCDSLTLQNYSQKINVEFR